MTKLRAKSEIEDDVRDMTRQLMQILPWHTRLRLQMQWMLRDLSYATIYRLPGYRQVSLLFWRAKRGGWAGVFEPPFDIMKQKRDTYDKRLRWHGWGVLYRTEGFRAYTPTSHTTECFPTTEAAWKALEAVYWGKPSKVAWIANRADGSSEP